MKEEMMQQNLKAVLTREVKATTHMMPLEENCGNNNGKCNDVASLVKRKDACISDIKVTVKIKEMIIDKLYNTKKYEDDPGRSDHNHDIIPNAEKNLTHDTLPTISSHDQKNNTNTSVTSVPSTISRNSKRKHKESTEYIQRMETIFENKPFPLYHSNVSSSDVESSASAETVIYRDYSEITDHENLSSDDQSLGHTNQNLEFNINFDNGSAEQNINDKENIIAVHDVEDANAISEKIIKQRRVTWKFKIQKVRELTTRESTSNKSNVPLQSVQSLRNIPEHYTCQEEEYFNNPLYWAACRGDIKDVLLYGKSGSMVQYTDHEGRTPLHMAVLDGNLEVIMTLIRFGADPNAKDVFGFTPLHYAVLRRRSVKITRILFSAGAVIPPKRAPMCPSLFLDLVIIATPTEEEVDLMCLLLQHGALLDDPNAPGGRQALHYAAMTNNATLTAVLMQLGADTNALNSHGMTPLEVARFYGCGGVAFTIEEIGLTRIMTDSRLSVNSAYA